MSKTLSTGIPGNMGLDHIGLIVPNVSLAATFLMDVFDCEFDWEVKREPTPTAGERGWDKLFGVHLDAYMPHVMMLKAGDALLTQYIELFEWKTPESVDLQGEGGWHRFSDIGNSYISFTVKDMDAVITHIKQSVIPNWEGVRLIQDPPMEFPLRGEVCRSTFLVSPWGMWIELTCWSVSKEKGQVIRSQRQGEQSPFLGLPVESLPTPALCVDLDAIDHNARLISQRLSEKNIQWRLPSKAHKSPALSQYLEQFGCNGVVLLTLNEVEAFAKAGVKDIYFANQVVTDDELRRLSLVAKQVDRLIVQVDNIDYLNDIAKAVLAWEITTPIDIYVELDINHHRSGTTIEEGVLLVQQVVSIEKETGALRFLGITGYEGHTPIMPSEQKQLETKKSHALLAELHKCLVDLGITVPVISAGGSCNYMNCLDEGVVTEIQAGGGVLCDHLYYEKAGLKNAGHKPAIFLTTQLTSVASDGSRAMGNAGFKACGWHPFADLPQVMDREDLVVTGLSAEHTKFAPTGKKINLTRGEVIKLLPGYSDPIGLLHQQLFGILQGEVERVFPIL